MCGILGYSSELDFSCYMDSALATIENRGPDNQSWEIINSSVTFGHTRLSVIDLSETSNQPLWDINKKACIVFNGEIYNYKELREGLITEGAEFKSEGDAEVILNCYLHGKADWIERLDGIFSFAIYDVSQDHMILARDHYGVKPLYYSESSDGVFFSSEMKAILKFPCIDKILDHEALWRSITFLWSPGPNTILSSVKKLEPGTMLKIKSNKIISKVKYWDWPIRKKNNLSEAEHISAVVSSLDKSVEKQLVSDVPVGAFLSGGVDSSILVAIASNKIKEPIECFTIDSASKNNDGFVDDLPYAKKVSELLNVPLNIVESKPEVIKDLYKMVYALDEPQADPAPLSVLAIAKLAKSKGIKVLLSGAGGDDLFTGYRRHKALNFEYLWSWLPEPVRRVLQSSARSLPKRNSYFRRFSKAFSYAGLDSNERLLSYFYWIDPSLVKTLFIDEIQKKLPENPIGHIVADLNSMNEASDIEKMLYLEKRYFLVDHNFNYTDKLSMACGVEVRVPFLDREVIKAAANIPDHLKQKNGIGKYILKKAAEKFLPKEIIYRSKAGFGAPLREWLNGDLKEFVDETLSPENINKRGVFKSSEVWKLINADRKGEQDYSYPIFSLLCIEVWCQLFINDKFK